VSASCAAPIASSRPASEPARATSLPTAADEAVSLPTATVKPAPCALSDLRVYYQNGRWKDGEQVAQRCLQENPLATEARVTLVRMYLMRAYAAKEPRWLDEARRQLRMIAADPAYADEARELGMLIEQPTME
jgi:hypothetical protein